MQLSRDHLTVLLNALYDSGTESVAISHPSGDVGELLTVQLAESATVELTSLEEYADARSSIRSEFGSSVAEEIPSTSSFANGLLAGGLLELPNQTEVDEFLDRYGTPDLTAGHRPVVAGFDTNLLPWRMADVLDLRPGQDGRINGFALSTGVRDELDWDQKRSETRKVEAALGSEFEQLWNQPRGARREGRLGENYYRRLRDHRYAEEVVTDRGDEQIVSGYEQFQNESRKEVLLFSNDRDFIERARSHRVLAQRVELPDQLPNVVETSWESVGDTLYVLAVLFGVLRLPKVTLYGVWKGKEGQAWEAEALKVDCRSPPVESQLQRDLEILQ